MYKYFIVSTAFHGGGIITRHKSPQASLRALRHFKNQSTCKCGCCDIVCLDADSRDQLVPVMREFYPYVSARDLSLLSDLPHYSSDLPYYTVCL